MRLFFVMKTDEDNYDSFITAPTAERALEIWKQLDFVRDVLGFGDGNIGVRVFRVPTAATHEMFHPWHGRWEERGVRQEMERYL